MNEVEKYLFATNKNDCVSSLAGNRKFFQVKLKVNRYLQFASVKMPKNVQIEDFCNK